MDTLNSVNKLTQLAYNRAAQRYHDLFHNEINEKEYDRNLLDRFLKYFSRDSLVCDAGCGSTGHIGRYLFDRGINVTGIDISEECIRIARHNNPDMNFACADITSMPFKDGSLDGIIAYYSIINTPRVYVSRIFTEFRRVLKDGGYLLTAVKAGNTEGYTDELLGIETKIYSSLFSQEELSRYYSDAGFHLIFSEKRKPYNFEINIERIFAIGEKR